jgi:hypothetical protein
MRFKILGIVLASLLFAQTAAASWLSEITGVNIDIPNGTITFNQPKPEKIIPALQELPFDIAKTAFVPGAVLATEIRRSRNQLRFGARPIPKEIAARLAPYFPPDIINNTTWNDYDPNRITFDKATFETTDKLAITIDDVIVFRNRPQAENPNEWRLWAHELTHVAQYKHMGVEGFATAYILDWTRLEEQAEDWEDHVWRLEWCRGAASQPPANVLGSFRCPTPAPASVAMARAPKHWKMNRTTLGQYSNRIGFTAWSNGARSAFKPNKCVQRIPTFQPAEARLKNVCGIPIIVTSWDEEDQQQQKQGHSSVKSVKCNCQLEANQSQTFTSKSGRKITDIRYRYRR